ncbi:MAG: 4Fe-4S binding protein [Anaerolineales bacterium]
MYGVGLLKGLGVTLRHFVDTWTSDLQWLGKRYTTETFAVRQGSNAKGIFTVEYPEEKIAVPERFRFVPFLVVNEPDDPYAPGDDWCTSCGICAKVCPPQCIWIVRGTDPETGRPKPQPEAFYIDIDICMNCGYCAEYCPFDAIKMDHDYEMAVLDRTTHNIHDKEKLSKPVSYWQHIAPTRFWEEAQRRGHWEHKDVEKLAKKAGITLPEPTEDNMERITTVLVEEAHAAQAAPQAAAQLVAPATEQVAQQVTVPADPLVAMEDESLPLEIRAAATLEVKNKGTAKEIKLSSANRKTISAVQKDAKAAGTTIEELSEKIGGWEGAKGGTVQATAPAASPAPAAAQASTVAAAPPAVPGLDANAILAAKELERHGQAKEIKLTGDMRKQISAAKKAAAEAGLDWQNLDENALQNAAPPAEVPPQAQATTPQPIAAKTPPPAEAVPTNGNVGEEIKAAKELERQGRAKEIKLTGEDRKRISAAKKAAQEQGVNWDEL